MNEFMANMNRGTGGDGAGGAGAGSVGVGGAGAGGDRVGGAGAGGARAGGAGPVEAEVTGCTYMTFMKEKDKVKFATATLQGRALTWWNGRTASMGIDVANGTPWAKVRKWMTEEFCPRSVLQRLEQELYNLKLKGTDIDGYTNRFHELALLYPRMVEPEQGEKRKGEGDRSVRGDNRRDYNNRQNQRSANARAMTNVVSNDNEVCSKCKNKKHNGDYWKCGKCGKLGHKTATCRCPDKREVTCFNCNKKGHLKKDCPMEKEWSGWK
ncbi:reverse transcriptase domain-containing protein [Tanacetum coccineum]